MRIRITKGNDEVVFQMSDNATSRDFQSLLPLTVDLDDYNRTEKVSPLPSKLSTADAPAGYDPDVGDLCLYAPWGNLCIFYLDFGYAGGLVKMGHAVSGKSSLSRLEGRVRIEVVE